MVTAHSRYYWCQFAIVCLWMSNHLLSLNLHVKNEINNILTLSITSQDCWKDQITQFLGMKKHTIVISVTYWFLIEWYHTSVSGSSLLF